MLAIVIRLLGYRKETERVKKKGLRILAAAAVLTFGCLTMNAYAAEGWALSNNIWTYLDKNGNRVTNEWKKGADNLWRYLNNSGEMAVNSWADNDYYVDANGIMVANKWMQIASPYSRDSQTYWFYFGSSGKVTKDTWKKIDGKSYYFDADGIMQTGWTEDGDYYLSSSGAMVTGWRYLEPKDEDSSLYGTESDDGKYWFYFSASGKKQSPSTSDDGGEYKVTKIDGKYYCFDADGRMRTGWVYLDGDPENSSKNSIADWRYFAESGIQNATVGAAIPGWLSLNPPEQLQDNVDEPVVWYYFDKNGEPKTGPEDGKASTSDFVRINGKTYLFDQKGNPVKGLKKVRIGSTSEYTSYYFDESSRTSVKGKMTVEEGDGNKTTFYFNEGTYAGRGTNGVKNGYLYYMGKLQQADNSSRYALISIPNGNGGYQTYVVNSSGRISKNTTVKDRDGNKYKVNSSGILTHINDEAASSTEDYGEPTEPVFEND